MLPPHLRPRGHRSTLGPSFPSTSALTSLPTGLAFPAGIKGLLAHWGQRARTQRVYPDQVGTPDGHPQKGFLSQ